MASEPKEEVIHNRCFESITSKRKGVKEEGIEEAVLKTKKILIAQKK